MGNIYVVEAISENYERVHEVILVTEDKEKAEVLARNEADDTQYGTVLKVWNNDEMVEEVRYHDRTQMSLILSEIPQDMNYWSKDAHKVIKDIKGSNDLKELVLIIDDGERYLETFIKDYIPGLPVRPMSKEQYKEFLLTHEPHTVLCSFWDEHLLPEVK